MYLTSLKVAQKHVILRRVIGVVMDCTMNFVGGKTRLVIRQWDAMNIKQREWLGFTRLPRDTGGSKSGD